MFPKKCHFLKCFVGFFCFIGSLHFSLKEADELTADPEGRWFSFNMTGSSYIILEKKHVPEHLSSVESLDTCMSLQSVICDLEDQGEATWHDLVMFFHFEIKKIKSLFVIYVSPLQSVR